jgi:penicillin-binding protein 1A
MGKKKKSRANRKKKQTTWLRKIGKGILLTGVAGVLGVLLFIFLVWAGIFGKIPTADALKNIDNYSATEVYSADSVLLGRYYIQERTLTDYNEISPNVINALVATEDVRFFEHNGVDYRSMFRVLVKTLLLGDNSAGGGSTISQQLAKNLFPRSNTSRWYMPVVKVKEAIMATRIEEVHSKESILTHYLNTVPFGDNVFGIEMASRRFFNKPANKLNQQEAAVLIGMLKANYTYNPRRNPEKSLERRNVVLAQMEKYGYLKADETDSLQQLPLELNYYKITHSTGLATYFREFLRPQLETWCANHTKPDGSPYNLYTDGLKVYTTLDASMQRYAEESMKDHMQSLQKVFDDHWGKQPWKNNQALLTNAIKRSDRYKALIAQGKSHTQALEVMENKEPMKIFAWGGEETKDMSPIDSVKHYINILLTGIMAMDPNKGDILAWVGGINNEYFKYDHVNKNTRRQVGSTFKPFVFAAALEAGMDPCGYISGARVEYTNLSNWSPGNADPEEYENDYSFAGALSKSVNTVSVKVLEQVGVDPTIKLVRNMGIESPLPEVPSIALGTADISLMEMVTAYAVFANGGRRIEPRYLTAIKSKDGEMLEEFDYYRKKEQVMSRETAEIMMQLLKGVVDEGTAARLRYTYGLNNDLAGKTGTTQSNADGWFIGFNRRLVIGVWVGADDPGVHFRTTNLGQGANMALPIFAKIFQKLNKDPEYNQTTRMRFPPPSRRIMQKLRCDPVKTDDSFFEKLFSSKNDNEQTERQYGEKEEKKDILKAIGNIFKKKKKD